MESGLLDAMCTAFWSDTRLSIGDTRRMAMTIPAVAQHLRSLGHDDAAQALEEELDGVLIRFTTGSMP